MKHFYFFLFMVASVGLHAQNFNLNYTVSKSDLEINSYSKDSTANALVIYDYGKSFIDSKTFKLRVKFKQKIKILSQKGLEEGNFEIKLYKGRSSSEKILNINGITYNNEGGRVVKTILKNSSIFEEDYKDYKLVKFVLPNVKVGSVITISYETQSPFIRKFQPWYFQGNHPVLYSEYNTSIPGNYEYNIKLVGTLPLKVHDRSVEKNCIVVGNGASANCSIAKYVMTDIPPYKDEDFTTTAMNYLSRIEYELSVFRGFDGKVDKITKSWQDVDSELKSDPNFGKQIGKSRLVKKVLPDSIKAQDISLQKAKSIYAFVQNNFKWNGKSEKYDVSIKEAIKEKNGSVFEINLMLENLLSSEGFKVKPILLSTRGNGLATKIYPVLTDFNYTILKISIDGQDYYLDATDPYLTFGELPYRCLNQYGRLIDFEDGSYWENINIEDYSKRSHSVEVTIGTDHALGNISSEYLGYYSQRQRKAFNENPIQYKDRKANELNSLAIENHDVINFNKNAIQFKEKIRFTKENEFIGNKMYFNPFVVTFFKENPFKLQERTFPIDFGFKDSFSYVTVITLEEGLKVVDLPDGITYILPSEAGTLKVGFEAKDNVITMFYKVQFDLAIYPPEYYPYLKELMNRALEIQNNSVIAIEKSI